MSTTNLEVLAYEKSPIGMICLRRRELLAEPGTVVTEITVDHLMLMSSCNVASERALAERALELHAGTRLHALVGGLGLGYTARGVLDAARVVRVEVVELLPQVIDWLDRGLLPLAEALRRDPRFALRTGDVYALLSQPPDPGGRAHDLLLIDVDHSPDEPLDPANAGFYTEDGLRRAKRHLAPGGLLGIWSYAACPTFEATLRTVFEDVRVEPHAFLNRLVDEEEANWLYFARG